MRLYKRAQILVADLWACFDGESYGEFHDIDKITMFAGKLLSISFLSHFPTTHKFLDYRIPQMLHYFGCLMYSPPLETRIRKHEEIPSGSNLEIELRATSIWCVELIRREIELKHPEAKSAKTNGHSDSDGISKPNGHSREPSQNSDGHTIDSQGQPSGQFRRHSRHSSASNARPGTGVRINAILIDFFLYDTIKDLEKDGQETIPHHRTRSIWY